MTYTLLAPHRTSPPARGTPSFARPAPCSKNRHHVTYNYLDSSLNVFFLTSKYGLISSKVLVREASSTKGVMAIIRSIMASLRDNMSISAADILKENIHRHVLPCELCGLRAAESFYGCLQERAHHLRKSIIYIREKGGRVAPQTWLAHSE